MHLLKCMRDGRTLLSKLCYLSSVFLHVCVHARLLVEVTFDCDILKDVTVSSYISHGVLKSIYNYHIARNVGKEIELGRFVDWALYCQDKTRQYQYCTYRGLKQR